MDDEESAPSPSRRQVFKLLSLVPLSAIGASACEADDKGRIPSGSSSTPYRPAFFTPAEWAFLHAACDRLIPADDIGPGALQVGVLEFIDRHMQTPYASGDIWYMQGPFIEAPPQFGYQGRLAIKDILRVGIHAVDMHCQSSYAGKTFAQLTTTDQEALLKAAEAGQLSLDEISAKEFFAQLLAETRLGYFCDPAYGGNKGMLAWKMVGYPGARADYTDWVEVRDQAYPLPPVDLAGKRG